MGPSPVKEAFAGRPATLKVEKTFCPSGDELQHFYLSSPKRLN